MSFLLDSHILIWAVIEPNRLSPRARRLIEEPEEEIFFSVASVWEIAIKAALGRADFRVAPTEIVEEARRAGFAELPIRAEAALAAGRLPPLHRDPFDRLLVAQAIVTPVRLLTADPKLAAYSELVTLLR